MSASTATAEEAKSEQTPYGSKPASNEEEAWSKPSEEFCEGGGTIRGVEDAAGTEELSCDNDLGENSELDKLGRKSAICEGRMSTPPLSRQACKKVFTRLETKSVSRDAKAEGGQGGKGSDVTAMF